MLLDFFTRAEAEHLIGSVWSDGEDESEAELVIESGIGVMAMIWNVIVNHLYIPSHRFSHKEGTYIMMFP